MVSVNGWSGPLAVKATRALDDPANEPEAQRPATQGAAPAAATTRARRALGGGALALGLGAAGEALLFGEALRPLGAALLGAAMAVAGWAWWTRMPAAAPVATRAGRPPDAWPIPVAWRLAGIAGALALALAALAAYRADPRALFGLQGILWLGAVGLLLLACARWYPRGAPDAGAGPPWARAEAAAFLGLLGLALVTHCAFLDAIPWRFHFDEGYAFTETLRYFQGPPLPLFTTTWHETSLPSLWFAFAGGLMRLTGPGLAGTRLGVALIGACLVIPVYGLGRLLAGRVAAALAAFGVAVSAAAVHYSRVSILNMTTAFAWAVCFYFLLRGLRSRRPGDFAWAGLAGGLSMYTYYGSRLLPVLLLAFLVYLLVAQRPLLRAELGLLALVPAGFLIGFGPLLGYFSLFPEMWTSRTGQFLDVPATIPTTLAGWAQDWNTLAPLAVRDFLALSVIPGQDTVYYAPLLLAPEAVLAAARHRACSSPGGGARRRFCCCSRLVGVLATGGLLIDASTIPSFAHWAPAFPVFYLAAALPLACLGPALARHGAALRRAAGAAPRAAPAGRRGRERLRLSRRLSAPRAARPCAGGAAGALRRVAAGREPRARGRAHLAGL